MVRQWLGYLGEQMAYKVIVKGLDIMMSKLLARQ